MKLLSGPPKFVQGEAEVSQHAMQGSRGDLTSVPGDGCVAMGYRDAVQIMSGAWPDEHNIEPAQSPTQLVVGQTGSDFARRECEAF